MRTILTLLFVLALSCLCYAQSVHPDSDDGFIRKGYSVWFQRESGASSSLSDQQFLDRYGSSLGLGKDDHLELVHTRVDELGWSHSRYVQVHAGVEVHGSGLILHNRDGQVIRANGRIYPDIRTNVDPWISSAQAIQKARGLLQGMNPSTDQPRLVIYPDIRANALSANLAYRIHGHSDRLMEDRDFFIDAHDGRVLRMIANVCLADEEGSAETLYSGTQTITTDNTGSGYRLKEAGRPIHTLNLNHAIDLGSVAEFTDSDNQWTDQIVVLRKVTVNTIGPGWWEDVPGDDDPDIYLVIKDGSNTTVATTPVMMDVQPPFSIPLQLTLVNPPYSISIFEEDGGSDDWGGPFTISASLGTKNFSILGNTGTYETVLENNPALDAHWGMEKTYDYFLNVHNRNSYDGMGSEMIAYIHFAVGWPNAFWSNNSLKLGDGDGIATNHRTYINVLSHEITHGVINTNGGGGLDYQGESGALNESFADIFGTAVEHYAKPGTADWLHGEEGALIPGDYVRSMEDPRSRAQPDTYGPNDSYWVDTQDTFDFGGVHVNSGVQNYWFYLVSEGGSGVNENGDAYTVNGIGIGKAEQIAYRNLTQYISASSMSDFEDSRMGSIMAAEDLYGSGSPEVQAVQQAWAAVGVGSVDPGPTCMGLVEFTDPAGSINDGSGMLDYGSNADCTWKVVADGYDEITLTFAEFDLATPGDTLFIFDGEDNMAPLLAAWTGNTLPGPVTSTDGKIFLHFMTDGSGAGGGWSLDYSSAQLESCQGIQVLTDAAGDLEDGSGPARYSNLRDCSWLIQPPNASGITLSFSDFDLEDGHDWVTIHDGADENAPVLGSFTGSDLPGQLVSTGGSMYIRFISDTFGRADGWSASYESAGPVPSCSGQLTIMDPSGTITDGSGAGHYGDNSDCSWLIEVPNANSIVWTFTDFDLENGPDSVLIYDGSTAFGQLLLAATGSNLPGPVTSSDGALFIRFITNQSGSAQGWSANYTATFMTYCDPGQVLTTPEGTLSDGSGVEPYGNASDCSWLIQPPNAKDVTLTFNAFQTEDGYDYVRIYDGDSDLATLLGEYSGENLPDPVMSTGGSLFVRFQSDYAIRKAGWEASYTSNELTGISDPSGPILLNVSPNPGQGLFVVDIPGPGQGDLRVVNSLGQVVWHRSGLSGDQSLQVDLQAQPSGVYHIHWTAGYQTGIRRVIRE